MKPKPGWHGYWKNPGDAGAEATVAWTLPKGVTVGPLRYPVPERLIVSGIMNYVYEHDYALLAELKLAARRRAGHAAAAQSKVRLSRLHGRDLRSRERRSVGGNRRRSSIAAR